MSFLTWWTVAKNFSFTLWLHTRTYPHMTCVYISKRFKSCRLNKYVCMISHELFDTAKLTENYQEPNQYLSPVTSFNMLQNFMASKQNTWALWPQFFVTITMAFISFVTVANVQIFNNLPGKHIRRKKLTCKSAIAFKWNIGNFMLLRPDLMAGHKEILSSAVP